MNTTTAIIIVLLVAAVVILVKLKKSSGQSEPESELDIPRESEIQKALEVPEESEISIDGQQLFKRARAIQQKYWTPNPDEKKRLVEKGFDNLAWDETLRLLHLACLEMLSDGPFKEQFLDEKIALEESADAPSGENRDLIVKLITRLISETSPYKPRHVAAWQGKGGESEKRKEDLYGVLCNASLTHLGCIEVIRLDAEQQPTELAFISLDEIRGAVFDRTALFRTGMLFFDDSRPDEVVLVPLLYGISWLSPHDFDQDGRSTRFICAIETDDDKQNLVIGVGHQDFVMEGDRQPIFGLGSIGEIMVVLFWDDPKFDQKCKARGLDPDDVRRSMNMKGHSVIKDAGDKE